MSSTCGDFSGFFFVSGDVLDLCMGNKVNKWIEERRDVSTDRERSPLQNISLIGEQIEGSLRTNKEKRSF